MNDDNPPIFILAGKLFMLRATIGSALEEVTNAVFTRYIASAVTPPTVMMSELFTLTAGYVETPAPSVKVIVQVVADTPFKCMYVAVDTVCAVSIVYVPTPPVVPAAIAVMIPPPAVFKVIPRAIAPLKTLVTVRVVPLIVPFTTASPVNAVGVVGAAGRAGIVVIEIGAEFVEVPRRVEAVVVDPLYIYNCVATVIVYAVLGVSPVRVTLFGDAAVLYAVIGVPDVGVAVAIFARYTTVFATSVPVLTAVISLAAFTVTAGAVVKFSVNVTVHLVFVTHFKCI